jgi:glycosyltransferase involved in cell wall biosynthesis
MKIVLHHGYYPEDGTRDEAEIMECYWKYLSQTDAEVQAYGDAAPNLSGADVAHLFGMSARTYGTAKAAADAGIPYVVTPLYWNDDYPIYYDLRNQDEIAGAPPIRERRTGMEYFRKMMLLTKVRQQKFILENAAIILASGKCEKMVLCRDFTLPDAKVAVMPVGVDLAMGMGKPDLFVKEYGMRDFILCAGPLLRRKNQHMLLEIARDHGMPVVLLMPAGSADSEYGEYCRTIAHDKTLFLTAPPPGVIKSAFHAARAFVQPSLSELPGVATLTAALAGLPIAVTDRGTTWDYLGPRVSYCEPDDMDSIAHALSRTLNLGPDPALKMELLTNNSWGKIIMVIIKLYRKLCDNKNGKS